MSELNNENEVTIHPIDDLPLATVSLVFGILSFIMIPFCGLVSLITGIFALVKINSSKGFLRGKGKAIAGIILGAWSILRFMIFGIILAVLLQWRLAVNAGARAVSCMTNLQLIATGMSQFAEEHNDRFPANMEELMDYMQKSDSDLSKSVFHCSLAPNSEYDFIPSAKGIELSKLQSPATTPVVICNKHPNKEIILYADGHVESKRTNDAP